MLGKGIAKKSYDKTMKIKTPTQLECLKSIRKPTLPPPRPHKAKKDDHRREIQEIVQQLTGKFRCVDY